MYLPPRTRRSRLAVSLDTLWLQGKGNKIMDQTFETFMKELREEHGQEESTVTGLCQKDRSGVSCIV